MKVLVFDTETTGLPIGRNPSITESGKWPHIVQLSYILYDMDENRIITFTDDIINISDDVNLTSESVAIHGITRERSNKEGIPIQIALRKFNVALKRSDVIVGHNISFDKRVIMAECKRNNIWQDFTSKTSRKVEYCTMKNTVELCKLEKKIKDTGTGTEISSTIETSSDTVTDTSKETNLKPSYKYPKLSELYCHLFNCGMPNGVHNAIIDVIVCLRCYVRLETGLDITTIETFGKLFERYGI